MFKFFLIFCFISNFLKKQLNDGNIHLGRDLWYQGPIFYMDDLRYYNKILKKNEIQNISAKG